MDQMCKIDDAMSRVFIKKEIINQGHPSARGRHVNWARGVTQHRRDNLSVQFH